MKKPATHPFRHQDSKEVVNVQLPLPLMLSLIDVKKSFFELCVEAGREVLTVMMENDRVALCGPKWIPNPQRRAGRVGSSHSEVTLGGRRISLPRLRARSVDGNELELPSFRFASSRDPLDEYTRAAIAVGVTTRHYRRTLDPLPKHVRERAVGRSSVSRRFVTMSSKLVGEWISRPIGDLDIRVVMIDGVIFRKHCVLIALGITAQGDKHVLGVREGSTENATVAQSLLSDLIGRGLPDDRALLFVIDGGKGIRKAIDHTFGQLARVQRCQVHKMRNVSEHLPDSARPGTLRAMRDAYNCATADLAQRQLERLARSLEREHPGAAASLREGLTETLTLQQMKITGALYRTLRSTNPIENLNGSLGRFTRNVKRWNGGAMLLRWSAAALHDAQKQFRVVRGFKQMPSLIAALRRHEAALKVDAKTKVA